MLLLHVKSLILFVTAASKVTLAQLPQAEVQKDMQKYILRKIKKNFQILFWQQ